MAHRLHSWLLRSVLLGALPLALGSHGCAQQEDEGAYSNPPGFSAQQTVRVAFSPEVFVRDNDHRVVSSTFARRKDTRKAIKQALSMRSDAPQDKMRLEASFGDSYADGVTVSVASRPEAYLRVVPVGAQPARGRVRKDGAVLSYENAYPRVTSAFGATQTKLEEFLLIPSEKDTPTLAYDLIAGPDFGFFEESENRLWAFSKDGTGLFSIPAPFADDAANKRVEGSWKLAQLGEGRYRLTGDIDLKGLSYPVLLDPTFETPAWFPNTTNAPNPRAAAAAAYDKNRNCTVMFGGTSNPGAFTLLADTSVRCSSDQKWAANISSGTAPSARAYHAMAYSGGTAASVFMFGGYSAADIMDDLWKVNLSCSGAASSDCTSTWTQITQPVTKPAARFAHGMAFTGSKILLFGGMDKSGQGLRDTWEYDADANTWTQLCATCFGGSFGLYGMSVATTVDAGGNREIYVVGGYDSPSDGNGNFTNIVYKFNGTDWDDVSGLGLSIPTNHQGVFTATSPPEPEGRYFHWSAATANNSILMGSGLSITNTGTETFYPNAWLWIDRSADGLNLWTRSPVPATMANAPGLREAATAVFDETRRDIVLFGGSNPALTAITNSARVYRTVSRDVTMTASCTKVDGDCNGSLQTLKVSFPGITGATAPNCGQMRVQTYRFSLITGQWEKIDATVKTPTFANGECSYSVTTDWDITTYVDFGAQVRDQRYHAVGAQCTSAGGELTGASPRAGCLSGSGFDASVTCGGLVLNQGDDQEVVDCIYQ